MKAFQKFLNFQTVHMDPCLDDCIMFGRKLKRIGHNVTLDVMDGLPHGFLNFSLVKFHQLHSSDNLL